MQIKFKLKEFEIFLGEKRRFRLRQDSSPKVLQICISTFFDKMYNFCFDLKKKHFWESKIRFCIQNMQDVVKRQNAKLFA